MRLIRNWIVLAACLILGFQNCSDFRAITSNSLSSLDDSSGPVNPPTPMPNPAPSPVPMQMPLPPVLANDPLCAGSPDATFPKFPNEPAGATRVVDWGFDSIEGPGLHDGYPDPKKLFHYTTTCSDAPFSPSSVLKNIRPISEDGSGGIQLDWYNNQKAMDEVYVGLVWKANTQFEGAYSNRLFIILVEGELQGFVSWNKDEGKTLAEGHVDFGAVANANNCHLVGNPSGCTAGPVNLGPNVRPDLKVGWGKWHLVEAILKRNSAPGVKDGRIRWWVDGVLVGDYDRFDCGGKPINWISYQQGWVNRILVKQPQATDWYYLADHIRISDLSKR